MWSSSSERKRKGKYFSLRESKHQKTTSAYRPENKFIAYAFLRRRRKKIFVFPCEKRENCLCESIRTHTRECIHADIKLKADRESEAHRKPIPTEKTFASQWELIRSISSYFYYNNIFVQFLIPIISRELVCWCAYIYCSLYSYKKFLRRE